MYEGRLSNENDEYGVKNASNGYDSLRDVPFAGGQADIPTKKLAIGSELLDAQVEGSTKRLSRERIERLDSNIERQKRKLVAAIGGIEGFSVIGRSNTGEITADMQENAYRRLRSKDFTRDLENSILVPIGSPMDETVGGANAVRNVAARLISDPGMMQVLGAATIANYGGSAISLDAGCELVKSIKEYCPSPADFFDRFSDTLQRRFELSAGDNHRSYSDFKENTENFMESVYGKRYQYWKALDSLKHEAAQYEQAYSPDALRLYSVPAEMREKMMKKAKIEGDNFKMNGLEYKLEPEYLARYGFGPEYLAQFEGAEIGLSRIFKNSSGRNVAMAYVRSGNEYCVRSYYKSQSQGVWRLLADYAVKPNTGERVGWYGKGFSEEQLVLPTELQEALSLVEEQGLRKDVSPEIGDFLLCGTAYRYNSRQEHTMLKMRHQLRGGVYRETSSTPVRSMNYSGFKKIAPQDVVLEGGAEVDMNDVVNPKYSCDTSYYGKVDVFLADSKDRNLRYSILRNSKGQRWFGGAEVKGSPINSYGLRRDWVELGDLSTPLIEYAVQSGNYGEPSKILANHRDMWSYLSRMPEIRRIIRRDFDNNYETTARYDAS